MKVQSVPRTMSLLPGNDEEFSIETREASPANLLIKIESFSLLSEYGIRKYESREFVAGDYKWRLVIHPEGYESEKEGEHVSVYLSASGTSSLPVDWEVHAIFSIFLYNQISDHYVCFRGKARRFHAVNPKWGFSKLISKKSLTDPTNGYLVDDKFWASEQFEAGDLKWKIRCPNGIGTAKGRCVSIFLQCIDSKSFAPHEKVKAKICFTIKNKFHNNLQYSKNLTHWFTSAAEICGFRDFIPIGDVREKGFVVGDVLSLETEIFVQAFVRDVATPKPPIALDVDAPKPDSPAALDAPIPDSPVRVKRKDIRYL